MKLRKIITASLATLLLASVGAGINGLSSNAYAKRTHHIARHYNLRHHRYSRRHAKRNNKHRAIVSKSLLKHSIMHHGDHIKFFTDDGLKGMADKHGDIEFYGGNGKKDMSLFSDNFPTQSPTKVKFDKGINVSHVKYMNSFLSGNEDGAPMKLVSIDLGPNFNTKNVADMTEMFFSNDKLAHINLGKKFNTNKVVNMSAMFCFDNSLKHVSLPHAFTTRHINKHRDIQEGSAMLDDDNGYTSMLGDTPKSLQNEFKSKVPSRYWNDDTGALAE